MSINGINKIGVLGFGKMGSDIFNYLSEYDFEVIVWCYGNEELERGKKAFCKRLDRKLKSGLINEKEHFAKISSVMFTADKIDFFNCNIIIECASEDITIKNNLLKEIDEIANEECIILSNSSSFIPSEILKSEKRKGKFAGLHFFYPLKLKNICELIISYDTSKFTINNVTSWLSNIDRNYILLNEENAFILNRVFMAFQAEAYNICNEYKISYKYIDNLVKNNIFPSGVFEFFDNVGIDVMNASFQNYMKREDDTSIFLPLVNEFKRLISLGELGVKTKSGFYDYKIEHEAENFPQFSIDKSIENEIIRKLINRYVLSAKSVVDKKICTYEMLDFAIKEYMSIDKGPFLTAAENNINLSD